MITTPRTPTLSRWTSKLPRITASNLAMTAVLVVSGFLLLYPAGVILVFSFNIAPLWFVGDMQWGLDNWRVAFSNPEILKSLGNTLMIWTLSVGISLPIATAVAWAIARTKVPHSHTVEFMFWLAFMVPGISNVVAWITLLDKSTGILNRLLELLPFVEDGPFNAYSVPSIIWVHLMTNGIGVMIMLLTPAFRNMDVRLEEAARVGGAGNLRTALRITLPLMISPIVLVFALQLVRIFQSFEIELLLGTPFNFQVYSTLIYKLVHTEPPLYGQAAALASLTLVVIAIIIPLQRWILTRRRYTTITGSFKPGLIDLGKWQMPVNISIFALIFLLVVVPVASLILTTFMSRAGFFTHINPVFTTNHWSEVLGDTRFISAFRTTFVLAFATAIVSPIIFSIFAYIIVRSRWSGRMTLDSVIWISAAIPGILTSLGLLWMFLSTFLVFLYGTIYALMLAVVFQGHTTGTNLMKGVFIQIGQDMEEAARVAGAGWFRTYFRIWLPLMMPTLILIGTLHFVIAAGTTANIILIAPRNMTTLSLLALEYSLPGIGHREAASVVSLIIIAMTVGVAVTARTFGLRMAVQHGAPGRAAATQPTAGVAEGLSR